MEFNIIIQREQDEQREVFTELFNKFNVEHIYAARLMEVYHGELQDNVQFSLLIFELLRICNANCMTITINFNTPFALITVEV